MVVQQGHFDCMCTKVSVVVHQDQISYATIMLVRFCIKVNIVMQQQIDWLCRRSKDIQKF